MKPILQNLVEMTGHRDHLRLEVSVLSTLQKLSATTEVRALEMFTDDGATHVRPRTWVQDGDLVSTDSEAASDPQREPLNSYPALCQCIEKREIRAKTSMDKGRDCVISRQVLTFSCIHTGSHSVCRPGRCRPAWSRSASVRGNAPAVPCAGLRRPRSR